MPYRLSATRRPRHLGALIRTLRENGRLLAILARWCESDRLTSPAGGDTFREPADIAAYLAPEMANLPQEQLRVVLLDRRSRLIDAPLVYQGGQSEIAVRLADCFRQAVTHGAAAIVMVHCHPSGDPSPSPDDVQLTHEAGRAGQLLGIDVLDHVILARDGFASLRGAGLYVPPEATPPDSPVLVDVALAPDWAYDCTRCGARGRRLSRSVSACPRCLAPVLSRMIESARPLESRSAAA